MDGQAARKESGRKLFPPAKPVVLKQPEHRISRRRIDPDALKVIFRLRSQGFIAYLTGGAVQNLMQDIPPKDFDIATDARPGQIKRRFSNARLIGRRFRLAHIHFKQGKIIEVATFRREPDPEEEPQPDETARKRPTYGTPREDAFRRDITINALFFDVPTSSVIDYVGGLKDLAEKRIRIIGDPEERFVEDPVRMIRVVRHAARLGFEIEEDAERTLRSQTPLLEEVSGSRLFEELNKDLKLKTRPIFRELRRFRMLKYYLGPVGDAYDAEDGLFARLDGLLKILEEERNKDGVFSQEEVFALLLWPWMITRFGSVQEDLEKTLKETLAGDSRGALIPRKLRASFFQILILMRNLSRARRTGRLRKSWSRRPHFAEAARLFFLVERGRLPKAGEALSLFPAGKSSASGKRRRRRRRPASSVDPS